MKELTRRQMMQMMAASVPAMRLAQAFGQTAVPGPNTPAPAARPLPPAPTPIIPPEGFGACKGPFEATWESLGTREIPEWYRDIKFGIWAHWGPQCQPERGDWYSRGMYIQGHPQYASHLKTFAR